MEDIARRCGQCAGPIPESARKDSRFCSRRCRTAAWRQRATAAAAPAPVEDERTTSITARDLADALISSARRTATALNTGEPAEPFDLDRLAVISNALIARARAAHPDADWADTAPHPTVTALQLRPAEPEPSRDVSAAPREASGQGGPDPARKAPAVPEPSRDGSADVSGRSVARRRTPAAKPLRLARRKALALLDTAELVKDPEHRENGRWHLVAADGTVIAHIAPGYSGARRSGWNAWPDGSTPNVHDRHPTRQTAAVRAADSWLRIVTAAPRR